MCSVMLAMIIFVLDLFKFPVTLNFFTRFPLCSNFIFATVSYCSSSSCFCSLAAAVDTFSSCCCPWLLLLLLFLRCLSISAVHILYSPSSSYIIKKQFHVRSEVFVQVHLMLLPWVLMQRCIILKLYFSKMCASFVIFLENFFLKFYGQEKWSRGISLSHSGMRSYHTLQSGHLSM